MICNLYPRVAAWTVIPLAGPSHRFTMHTAERLRKQETTTAAATTATTTATTTTTALLLYFERRGVDNKLAGDGRMVM